MRMSSITAQPVFGSPDIKRVSVATHYLRYALGNVLVMAAGFVSFPIMTRLLDTGQYGMFGYFDAWLLILAGLFKLGAQHTILRFYPHAGGVTALARFGANFVLLPFVASVLLWMLALAAYAVIVMRTGAEESRIGWVMLLLLLPTIWISFAGAFAFAEERSDISVRISVAQRWLDTFSILLIVYFIERSAFGAYLARLLVAVFFALGLAYWLRSQLPMQWRDADRTRYAEGLRYGLPLVANEIATNLLSFADRLMLRQMLGNFAAVGIYTIGFGLALNINNLFNFALYNAYTQVSIREYETRGAEAVLRTKRVVLHMLVYVTVAMVVGLLSVGPDVLLLMAGDDKSASAMVFVIVGITYTLDGLFGICGAGLLLMKRSNTVLLLTLAAAGLNVLLNLIWIPAFGVMGSVYASAASIAALNVLRYLTCPPAFRALPDLRAVATAVGLGTGCIAIAEASELGGLHSHFARLAAMALVMLLGYVLPAFAIDRRLREAATTYLRRHGRVAR
jgi:O-antigen/teichoic acid export membrane protein